MWNESLVFSLADSTSLTVTGADIWQGSLTIEQSVSTDGMFEIGSTHVGQMSVSLIGISDSIDFTDAVVTVSMSQGSDALQQIGVYTVVRAEHDNGIISITAYDNMNNLSEPYTTALVYPSTYGAMVAEIVGTTIQFDGSTTAVSSAPEFDDDVTKREVLGYIAQACGYNVRCASNGGFEFVRFNMSGFNTQGAYHEISSLFDFHHSHYPVVITGAKVIVRTTVTTTDPDTGETTTEEVVSTYTSGTDDYQIVIEGNPLITTANGQLVANTIFATFGGVEFYTGTVAHLSDLSIKASDIMKVTDRTNTTYPMLVSSTTISTGSPQTSQSYAEEPITKYAVQPSIMDRVQTSVRQALLDAKNGQNKANYAARIASNTNQYFWHTSTGTDTGAHITEIPREDFLADPTNGGGNTLIRSNGVAVRDGLTELSTFSANGCYLGNETTSRLLLNNVGVTGMTDTGVETFKIVAGDYSGTQTITETTGIVENTASDKSAMNTFYRAQQTPSASTTVTYTINAVVEFRGYTKNTNLQFSYMYDPDDMTMSTAGSGSVMMFPDGYVYVACDVQYPIYAVNMSFALTASNGGTIQNAQISVSMLIPDPVLPSYTFGLRSGTRAEEGAYSFAGGTQNIASGEASSVFGVENVVGGMGSASFGAQNAVTGNYGLASGQGNIVTGDKATALGDHLLAYTSHQTVLGHYNIGDENDEYALIVGNGDVSDRSNAFTVGWNGFIMAKPKAYTPTWATGHAAADYHCVVSAGICSFSYRGPTIAHSAGTQIGTLPVGARPTSAVYCPFVKMGGGAVGCIRIQTTGVITVLLITDTSSTGRLYFNCTFPVV